MFALAALAIFLTRLPWIWSGYGSDPDGYRVVIAARHIAATGQYVASRLPGYPVYEYLTALTARAAPWASNLVTALFSVAAFLIFALILRHFQVRRAVLLAAAFAMTPVVYANSSCTMDYIPALALMLAATYAVLRSRPALAGLCLGLAIGCRITAGASALPLCVWMLMGAARRRALAQCLIFGVTSLLVGALCFLPVIRRYGAGFFAFYDNGWYPPLDVVYARALPLVWGSAGLGALAALLCVLPIFHRHVGAALRVAAVRRAVLLAALVTALYSTAFLRLPDEAGYLLPIVPFVLLAIDLLVPAWVALALALSLLLSSLVAIDRGGVSWRGPIIEDHAVRESQQRATGAVIDAVAKLPGHAVIVAGWVLPRLELALNGDREGPHRYVYLVENEGDYRHYLEEGYEPYFLPGVDLYESQAHDLELAQLGAKQLDVPRERQRPASTGE